MIYRLPLGYECKNRHFVDCRQQNVGWSQIQIDSTAVKVNHLRQGVSQIPKVTPPKILFFSYHMNRGNIYRKCQIDVFFVGYQV